MPCRTNEQDDINCTSSVVCSRKMVALFKRLSNCMFCPHWSCPNKYFRGGNSKSTVVSGRTMSALLKQLFYSLCCPHQSCHNKHPK
eukprot:1159322-Pelagomonas_calceolata.AAC.2